MTNSEITNENEWFLKLQAEAEKIGTRLHLIPKLVVDYTKPYKEVIIIDRPQPVSDYDIHRLSDRYQLSENKILNETIVLFNWIEGDGNYPKTIKWGLQNDLQKTTPHVIFAIGKLSSDFYDELDCKIGLSRDQFGKRRMFVAETTGCLVRGVPRVCQVYWNDTVRTSQLWEQWFCGGNLQWFAFRKKIIPTPNEGTIAGSYDGC